MPDYFRSIINKETDKEASRLVTQIIHNELGDVFEIKGKKGQLSTPDPSQENSICTLRMATETTDNSTIVCG